MALAQLIIYYTRKQVLAFTRILCVKKWLYLNFYSSIKLLQYCNTVTVLEHNTVMVLLGTTSTVTQVAEDDATKRFCMITVSGVGIKENKDFYVKGTFTSLDPAATIGPFGGIAFNVQDIVRGNYVMMRFVV